MDVQLPGGPVFSEKCLPSLPAVERRSMVFLVWILFCYVLLVVSLFVSPFVCCFLFLGDFLQNLQHETKIVKKTVTKTFKIDTNRGHTGKSMPRNVITLGSPKGFGPMRSSCCFFLLCRFCQLLLRGQGFSLQNCHFLFPSDLLSSDYFVLIRWTKATQLTYIPNFPAPTHNKKKHVVIHFHQGHPQTWINHEF